MKFEGIDMKHLLTVGLCLGAMLGWTGSADAIAFLGTPNPSLSPVFGKLVNFDDKPAETEILPTDYVSLGVASITEIEGLGSFARYDTSSQSNPNYIGTGFGGERNPNCTIDCGWDGTIRFELQNLASMVGLGIADSRGGAEILSIYDANFNLLETFTAPVGMNSYVVFQRTNADIKYFEIKGDFFAADDLQFNVPNVVSIPEPATMLSLIAFGALGAASVYKRKQQ
jgi:hypothetical protein